MKIKNFEVFSMRDPIPKTIEKLECGFVNFDSDGDNGTHWLTYVKPFNDIVYFDSYRKLSPPTELLTTFKAVVVMYSETYNYVVIEKVNSYKCGHYCLIFIRNNFT